MKRPVSRLQLILRYRQFDEHEHFVGWDELVSGFSQDHPDWTPAEV